jgi:hypothetical protein
VLQVEGAEYRGCAELDLVRCWLSIVRHLAGLPSRLLLAGPLLTQTPTDRASLPQDEMVEKGTLLGAFPLHSAERKAIAAAWLGLRLASCNDTQWPHGWPLVKDYSEAAGRWPLRRASKREKRRWLPDLGVVQQPLCVARALSLGGPLWLLLDALLLAVGCWLLAGPLLIKRSSLRSSSRGRWLIKRPMARGSFGQRCDPLLLRRADRLLFRMGGGVHVLATEHHMGWRARHADWGGPRLLDLT